MWVPGGPSGPAWRRDPSRRPSDPPDPRLLCAPGSSATRTVPLTLDLLRLLGGFVLLAGGAMFLVTGGVTLARRLGVSPLVTGLTIVALGTSLPEVVVGGLAAARGEHGILFGTVLGSNIANIALVLGVTTLVLPAALGERLSIRELGWLLGSLGLLAILLVDGSLDRIDAVVLLGAFAFYQVLLFRNPGEEGEGALELEEPSRTRHPLLAVLGGSVGIAFGAELVMQGGVSLATRLGVPPEVVGFTVLALGTSLPELAAGVASGLKGHAEVGIGNVVGSNVFNVLAVVGVGGLVRPTEPSQAELVTGLLRVDLPLTAAVSVGLGFLLWLREGRGLRSKGALLAAGYVLWSAWSFSRG